MPTLIARPHPLRSDAYRVEVPAGATLDTLLGDVQGTVHAQVNGDPWPRERWGEALPEGIVSVYSTPQDDALRFVAQIAVVAAASWVAGPLLGLQGWAAIGVKAGITVAGSLAVNALIPPKMPSQQGGDTAQSTIRQSITGTRNQANPYGVVPRVYGNPRWYPPLAGNPVTEINGNDQYLRMALCLGYGPLEIGGKRVSSTQTLTQSSGIAAGNLRIGETDIHQYDDVEYEIGYPQNLTLFNRDIEEESVGVALDLQSTSGESNENPFSDNVSAVRTTAPNTREISVDIVFGSGLYTMGKNGEMNVRPWVDFRIQYRAVGSSTWTTASTPRVSGHKKETLRKSYRWRVPQGQYEVQVTRVQSLVTDREVTIMDAAWTTIRSVQAGNPYNGNHVIMALRIRATDQLNGVIDQLNVRTQAVLRVWNGSGFVTQATSNPAWSYLNSLTGEQVGRPIADTKIDLDGLLDWANWCDSQGLRYHWVHDSKETLFDRARTIAAGGQASFSLQDGLFGVVRDDPSAPVVQVITPRNASGFESSRQYKALPHALRVKYVDPNTWSDSERIIYRDGYSASNATIFEDFETQGVASASEAWHHGQYYFRQAILRPETFSAQMDWEHLAVVRGNRVRLAYDTILVGQKWGRIKAIDGATLTLDERVLMELDVTYGVRVRCQDGEQLTAQVVSDTAGETNVVTLTEPVSASVSVGDLLLFGELGKESIDCKVTRIEPGADLTATLTLVDAATDIYNYGTPPDYDPGITQPTDISEIEPPKPLITNARGDETALLRDTDGSWRVGVKVAYVFSVHVGLPALEVEARYRVNGSDEWFKEGPFTASGALTLRDVEEGDTYEIQVRSRNGSMVSAWSPSETLLVTGKSNPPPDVDSFTVVRMADGTRRFAWTLEEQPLDLRGYRIRYAIGTVFDWATAMPLHKGILTRSPIETNDLAAGTYTFGIVAEDTSANQSANPLTITATLGDPRLRGVLLQHYSHDEGWPGTLSAGNIDLNNVLTDGASWDTLPDTWDALASSWDAIAGAGGITYETVALDLGTDTAFTPLVSVVTEGAVVLGMRVGTEADGGVVGDYVALSPVVGKRYVQIKIEVTGESPKVRAMTVLLDGEPVLDEYEDVDPVTNAEAWFERIGTGHFRIAARKNIASISYAAIKALQGITTPHTWALVSKAATVTGNTQPAAEFRIWDSAGNPADVLVDIEIKGPKAS